MSYDGSWVYQLSFKLPLKANPFPLKAIVCTLAIFLFRQIGLFKNLAPFDSTKAKKCENSLRHWLTVSVFG